MKIRWCLHSALFALWLYASGAAAQQFKADIASSEWKAVSASPVCTITHTIPDFGKAVFMRTAGKSEVFYIESQNKMTFSLGEVKIETLPPVWHANFLSVELGKIVAVTGNQPIKLMSVQAKQMLEYLEKGFNIAFTSQRSITGNRYNIANGLGSMRIILEAKNFVPAYKSYQYCTGDAIAPIVEKTEKELALSKITGYVKRDVSIYRQGGSRAREQTFSPDSLNGDWKSFSNPFACSMTHNIPGFGKATLSHKTRSEEIFSIESIGKFIFPVGNTSIDTLPSAWRNSVVPINLGVVPSAERNKSITLKADDIAQVVSQLASGVRVMFTSSEVIANKNKSIASADTGVVRVVLESRNFAGEYRNYQQCVGNLIHYTFAQVARSLINFSEKQEGLTAATKMDLTRVARYFKADQKVLGVLVDAHSDNAETSKINEATSKQYADWVSAYLIEQGVPADKIARRWHGEKFPIASNKTAQGRSQNRRVTVRLETEDTRLESAKNVAARKAALEAEKLNPEERKVTPEDIDRMVEGLDLIPQK